MFFEINTIQNYEQGSVFRGVYGIGCPTIVNLADVFNVDVGHELETSRFSGYNEDSGEVDALVLIVRVEDKCLFGPNVGMIAVN